MALKMARLFGNETRAENTDFDVPTTQVRMSTSSPEGYDTPTTMSVMEQLRTASNAATARPKLGLIGNLPVVRQFQVLGVLTVAFLALARGGVVELVKDVFEPGHNGILTHRVLPMAGSPTASAAPHRARQR